MVCVDINIVHHFSEGAKSPKQPTLSIRLYKLDRQSRDFQKKRGERKSERISKWWRRRRRQEGKLGIIILRRRHRAIRTRVIKFHQMCVSRWTRSRVAVSNGNNAYVNTDHSMCFAYEFGGRELEDISVAAQVANGRWQANEDWRYFAHHPDDTANSAATGPVVELSFSVAGPESSGPGEGGWLWNQVRLHVQQV